MSPLSKDFSVNDLAIRVAILETQLEAAQMAMKLQAREYERRLDELNHSHAQQVARNANYVGREVWDLHVTGNDAKFNILSDRLNRFDVTHSRLTGMAIGISIGAGFAGGSVGALIMKLLR